jgi:hypothetical protein
VTASALTRIAVEALPAPKVEQNQFQNAMNDETFNSLCAVLDYLMPEEERHWEEMGKPDDHIFLHVRRVDNWATEVAKDYVDD